MDSVEIEVDLQCELNEQPISISSAGETIFLRTFTWPAMFGLARLSKQIWSIKLEPMQNVVTASTARVCFQVRNRTVASAGGGIREGLFHSLGWPPLRLHPIAIAATLFTPRQK